MACKLLNDSNTSSSLILTILVLDPQISYEGVKEDYEDDEDLLTYLEDSHSCLDQFFKQNYVKAKYGTTLSATGSTSSVGPAVGSPKKVNFTARYQKKDCLQVDELEEYFKLPCEDFDSCDPLKWWLGRRAQFPNLYRLVCDIFRFQVHVKSLILILLPLIKFIRFSHGHQEDIFRGVGYHFSSSCQPPAWYNSGSHACETLSPPCTYCTQKQGYIVV